MAQGGLGIRVGQWDPWNPSDLEGPFGQGYPEVERENEEKQSVLDRSKLHWFIWTYTTRWAV